MSVASTGFGREGERRDVTDWGAYFNAVVEIAKKEVLIFTRSKRLYVMGGLYALGFLSITILLAYVFADLFGTTDALFGDSGFFISRANLIMLVYLSLPLIGGASFLQILGIVFTFDAVVREYEDKTLFLILAKPVPRSAVVFGKFLGAVVALGAIFLVISTLAYFLVMLVVGEFAPVGDILRYYGALGIILTGLVAFASLGLFGSIIARTTTMSMLFSLGMWLVVLEILSYSGLIYAAVSRTVTMDHWLVKFSQYANPATSIGPATQVLLNYPELRSFGLNFSFASGVKGFGLDPWVSFFSLLTFSAVFIGATLLIMQRRNFE